MKVVKKEGETARDFYDEALRLLKESGIDFMLGGGFAFAHYTGILRDTKDLDVFCRYRDYPSILKYFEDLGFETELTDVRWLAKIRKDEYFIDIIFDSVNNICTVDDSWFQHAEKGRLHGYDVLFVPPEEMIWCKIYVQNRERYDGADVNHLILKSGKTLDWERLFSHLDHHWHILLAQLLQFQFIYPVDFHDIIPRWLFDELLQRAATQYELPQPVVKVCRGPMIDQTQYSTDIRDWGYKSYTIITV